MNALGNVIKISEVANSIIGKRFGAVLIHSTTISNQKKFFNFETETKIKLKTILMI